MKTSYPLTLMLSVLVVATLLPGCQLLNSNDDVGTIASLPKASLPNANNNVEIIDQNKIARSYQAALTAAQDPILRQQIMVRIADFEMARSETQQLQTNDAAHYFAQPIELYRELIAMQENSGQAVKGVDVAGLRYKLAKALSLDGRIDEAASVLNNLAETAPTSPYIDETQFRRAEKAFADGDYRAASEHYQSVAAHNNSLQQNAIYMQGWSEFKHGDYEQALHTFSKVMDQVLGAIAQTNEIDAAINNLSPAQANIMSDTLHVMSLAFSYLDGAPAISQLQAATGSRGYEYLFYEQLGELYVEQNRFSDAAETYKHYVKQHPLSDLAPQFSIRMISVYEQGNFPSLVLPAKQAYVQQYGMTSDYWKQHQGVIDKAALDYLQQSLQELAQYEHAQAQTNTTANRSEAMAAYKRAALWYREYVSTFPNDSTTPELNFLLAESLAEVGDALQAISAYQKVAYQFKDEKRGADSGYSTLLMAQQLITSPLFEQQKAQWQDVRTQYSLLFANNFPSDPRVPAVLVQAAQDLLDKGTLTDAIVVAARVINSTPAANNDLLLSAWLVTAHSQFEAKHFSEAETAYRKVLQLLPSVVATTGKTTPTSAAIQERVAASIYQQAQMDLQQQQKDHAITKLLRINQVAPGTEIAIKSQYDAGVYLIEQQQWQQAEKVYSEFRKQYPAHSLTATLPAKMVMIYQNQAKWALAAAELALMERSSNDPAVKRESLVMGAELYQKSGNKTMALELYQRYANEYPKPIAEAMEAQYQVAQLYRDNRDSKKQNLWLQRLVASDASAGAERSDRSRYLAASAASELSAESYITFASLPLNLPLKQSLQRKRAALDTALKEQEAILNYGVAEFTTQASFRIGEIYGQLSRDLMASERPKDLDVLALEQYDILLEEQAYPFEEKAIQIHQTNSQRSWKGIYDPWVKNSFNALATLLPARYKKLETRVEVSNEIQ